MIDSVQRAADALVAIVRQATQQDGITSLSEVASLAPGNVPTVDISFDLAGSGTNAARHVSA